MLSTGREQIILLTWTAASFDAISYVALGEVFTANMTGNTVLLGLSVTRGDVAAVLRSCTAVGGFCLGALLGSFCIIKGRTSDGGRPARVTAGLAAEALILSGFAVVWLAVGHNPPQTLVHLLIVVAGGAMGLQSVIVLHLRIPGVSTTYITGTLAHLMMLVPSRLIPPASGSEDTQDTSAGRAGQQLAEVWLVYLVSAVFTGLSVKYFHMQAVFIPPMVILLVLADRVIRAWRPGA